jgi:hypothetical protein
MKMPVIVTAPVSAEPVKDLWQTPELKLVDARSAEADFTINSDGATQVS